MKLLSIAWSFLAIFVVQSLNAQEDPIYLSNPSFEDMPRHSKTPRGWYNCGVQGESPPDIQPSGTFSVTKPAVDGNTYLGMVVRDNDTWEGVSQPLSRPMKKGQCYEFSISLARSELYVSTSRITNESANYTTPAKVRIYGGFDYCDKQYMLGETNLIINTRWLEYNFKFEPIANYTHIIFEVFYKTPTLFPYNGNVLLDNASPITPIPCEEEDEEILAEKKPEEPVQEVVVDEPAPKVDEQVVPTPPKPEKVDTPKAEKSTTPAIVDNTPVEKPKEVIENTSISTIKRSELKEGTKIRVDKLYFQADKAVVTDDSYSILNEIFDFMKNNPDVEVEIGGHTNGLPPDYYCDRLSTERARAVVDYLVDKGIERDRLTFRGYGKRQPIASDETQAGRKKNQRVEVTIIGFNG